MKHSKPVQAWLDELTKNGIIDPTCKMCRQYWFDNPKLKLHESPWCPAHTTRCGNTYSHCTCDGCF